MNDAPITNAEILDRERRGQLAALDFEVAMEQMATKLRKQYRVASRALPTSVDAATRSANRARNKRARAARKRNRR